MYQFLDSIVHLPSAWNMFKEYVYMLLYLGYELLKLLVFCSLSLYIKKGHTFHRMKGNKVNTTIFVNMW